MTSSPLRQQKGRDKRDIILVIVISSAAVWYGLHILARPDRDGFFVAGLGMTGLYYCGYRIIKYIKTYTNWL